MKSQSLSDFLKDILDSIEEIEQFTQNISFEQFLNNREKLLAVVKLLEIIGEATKKIPDSLRQRHPQIPWRSVAGMRDLLVHEYWGIDPAVIWRTIQESIPQLKVAILDLIHNATQDHS